MRSIPSSARGGTDGRAPDDRGEPLRHLRPRADRDAGGWGVVELDVQAASLGGAFWIVLLFVPLLLCTHAVLFVLLMRRGTIR